MPVAIVPEQAPVEYFIQGFQLLGYQPCDNAAFEVGYQKVAIYANALGVTHMARQHLLGRGWLSKVGVLEDIFHPNLSDLEGHPWPFAPGYGLVVQVLKRSWWAAAKFGLLRGLWASFKFWVCRIGRV